MKERGLKRADTFQAVVAIYNELSMAKIQEFRGPKHQDAMRKMIDILANRPGAIGALSRFQVVKSKESGYL